MSLRECQRAWHAVLLPGSDILQLTEGWLSVTQFMPTPNALVLNNYAVVFEQIHPTVPSLSLYTLHTPQEKSASSSV